MLVYCRGRSWNEMLTLPACKRTRDEISSFRGNRDSSPLLLTFPTQIFHANFRIANFPRRVENLSIFSSVVRLVREEFKASCAADTFNSRRCSSIMHGGELQPFATLETVDRYCMEIEKRIRRN